MSIWNDDVPAETLDADQAAQRAANAVQRRARRLIRLTRQQYEGLRAVVTNGGGKAVVAAKIPIQADRAELQAILNELKALADHGESVVDPI
ncbi:MAG: hypothetical protein HN919_18580 [Verrucomicrobia bacterium]|jgi:hypothetical protein|nr:hypothetical protein [Verrucomicrobiota bacterium]MBT7702345.1 hypothetical protein [Verrucomicrobiota bacterium]